MDTINKDLLDLDDPQNYHKSGIVFGIIVFLYQILICFFYGYWFSYQPNTSLTVFDQGQLQLVAFLIILVLVGFGLTNAYITNSSFSGMGLTLLIFGLTLEHYFLIKAFWEKAGTPNTSNLQSWENANVNKISFVNYNQDFLNAISNYTQSYSHYSFVDAIACSLANVVAFASLVGRIKLLQSFFLSLIGTFLYEVNAQLLFRFQVLDSGYGMRIFVFGGFFGLISSLILGKKETTVNSQRYMSIYASRAFGLLGLLFQFCTFPCLVAASIYKTSANRNAILYSSVLRMYLALGSGILGSFSASALTYRKIHIHDLIFGGLAGGVVYSSSCDLNPNPAVPLGAGFIMGFFASFYHSSQMKKLNSKGVISSLAHYERFILPGMFSGILSGILYAIQLGSQLPYYTLTVPGERTNIQQGGMQIAGMSLSIAIGIFAGIVSGILYKFINRNKAEDQFRDHEIFRPDFPPGRLGVQWQEI